MNASLVSVIIPAYNAARTLAATIQSVFEQTIQDFEIIVVDDGSTDDTLKTAQAIAEKYERVKVIAQPNSGAAAARNTAIRAAQGKYIALLDADDLWVSHKLERQLEILENGKKIYAVQSGAFFVNDDLELISVRPCAATQDALLETLLFQNMPNNMSTLVIKREMFEKMGYFDTELEILEEWDMAIKVSRSCNLLSIEEPLSLYRVHAGNRSRNLAIHIKPGHKILERIFQDASLPAHIKAKRRLIYSHFYTMLSGGALKIGQHGEAFKWALKSISYHPSSFVYMIALPSRRFKRNASRETVSEKDRAIFHRIRNQQKELNTL